MLNIFQARQSAVVFYRIVKKGGNHHFFCDLHGSVSSFRHYKRRNAQEVGHVGSICALAPFNVEVPCIADCVSKFAGEVKLFALVQL